MKQYNYKPEKRQLTFLSNKGKPVFGLVGPIAEKTYARIAKTHTDKEANTGKLNFKIRKL